MRWGVALAGLAAGMIAGCLLELDDRIACGDAFHDAEHEDCDPADLDSVPAGCSCDPQSCTLNCCGDGIIGGDEECEGTNWKVRPQCQEWSCENCRVTCPPCGNGQLDYGEECDFEFEAISTMPTSCDVVPVPGRPDDEYQPGGNPICRSDCNWDRTTCNLCGNGNVDGPIVDPITGNPLNAPELCDAEDFDLEARFDRCLAVCGEEGRDCKATCGASCLEIIVDPEDRGCCVRTGFPRTDSIPCCCELPEGEAPSSCTDIFDPPLAGQMPTPECPG